MVKVYLGHEHIWVSSAALQIWLSKAPISLRSPGETSCDAKLSGCSFAAAEEDLWVVKVELRSFLLSLTVGSYLDIGIHVDKVLQNSSLSVLL